MRTHQPARNSRLWPIIAEAESVDTTPDRLRELSQHSSHWVRRAAQSNPKLSDAALVEMIADPRNEKFGWSDALRSRRNLESAMAIWPSEEVRCALAATYLWEPGALSRNTQELLSTDQSESVRVNIAKTASYRDLFETLLADTSAAVRGACAANPRIEREQTEQLITDRRKEVRVAAVHSGMRYPDEQQLLLLASDKSADVRYNVLFHPRASREAIELIAHDKDDDIRRAAQYRLDGHPPFSQQVVESTLAASERATPGDFETA